MRMVPRAAAATTSARLSGRRDEDVVDGHDRGPTIAGDGDGRAADEVLLRDGVDEGDGED
jgi:hypothetical protein